MPRPRAGNAKRRLLQQLDGHHGPGLGARTVDVSGPDDRHLRLTCGVSLEHDLLRGDLRVGVGDAGRVHRPTLVDVVGKVEAERHHRGEVNESSRAGVASSLERKSRSAHVDLPEAGFVARHPDQRRRVDDQIAAFGGSAARPLAATRRPRPHRARDPRPGRRQPPPRRWARQCSASTRPMNPLAPVMQIRAMAGDRLPARRQRFQRAPAGRCVGEDGVALGRIVAIALLLGVMTCAAALAGTRAVQDSRAGEMVTARTRGAGPLTSVTSIRRARRFAASRQGRVAFAVLDDEHRPRGLLRTAHFPSASVSKAMLLVAMLRRAPTRSLNDGERKPAAADDHGVRQRRGQCRLRAGRRRRAAQSCAALPE